MTQTDNQGPADYAAQVQQVARALLDHSGPTVVLTHENPDGDALGSVLGLTRALRELGREVYAPMTLPRYLQFLPEEGELCAPLTEWPAGALAAVLDVDSNDHVRVGGAEIAAFGGPVVNIDHHGTNQRQADTLLVDPSQPATAQMMVDVLDALEVQWTEALATPLLLGLITDTGSFQFSSTTPQTLRTGARLLEYGARLNWLNEQRMQNSPTYYILLREVLNTLEFAQGGQVVLARVDDAMLERAGANWDEVDPYVGMLRNAEGALLAVLVKDYGDRVKFSLRSRGGLSAQNIAVALGGGGHVPAAGATVEAPYAEARARLDAAVAAELERLRSQPQDRRA
ncbi:phosphoesterase RecJ domain protein [Deinococcus proteolyticus MRP]|uniref:Phosphoesterase RecJ domain protein n=1 Tax=Deinococcus proteolyticus (strain ATCC 35074 / DSM 20540 / JCM 6276 / NBRC 101906 / NCIMB 13154 / VKM Ac-1939 / CCM 2703 / MRP) TaxID=693977 RepID=F0RNM6_DEIPM|nr:bifunctional oligoribonuclease/PAP phosphatase NrnA [Deinococcus proteolyticus]ADY26352.1 phosphoesterase RecJ domain protein [Deinococcus proteolyticus MRP]